MLSIDSIRLKNLNCEIDVKDEIIFTLFKKYFLCTSLQFILLNCIFYYVLKHELLSEARTIKSDFYALFLPSHRRNYC